MSSSMVRTFLVVVVCVVVVLAIWTVNSNSNYSNNNTAITVPVIEVISGEYDLFKEPVVGEENIIFLETKCARGGPNASSVLLRPRQACAMESAALTNPQASVYMLHGCEVSRESLLTAPEYVRRLFTYPNVHVWHLNWTNRFTGTPLEEWFTKGDLYQSQYPVEHISDVLRYVVLWKYGGSYLDHDVVVVRSLSGLSNFAGAESQTDVAAGVLNFAHNGSGHEMAEACLEDIRTQFRGDDWGHNGPGVITRVLKQVCDVRQIRDMTPERCRGFTVHPPSVFYPIPWRQWKLYFEEKTANKTMSRLSDSLAIHVWNKFSVTENITVGSRQPYGLIAQKYCPKVYSHCGKVF